MTEMVSEVSTEIRVRYSETDAMGLLHHANYVTYFEIGRTELLRAQGGNYRRMEELGMFMVVVSIAVKYKRPARYDDLLTLRTQISGQTPAKLHHRYELFRGNELLCTAESVLACVDRSGMVQRIPDNLSDQTGKEKKMAATIKYMTKSEESG